MLQGGEVKMKPAVVEQFAGIDVARAMRELSIDTGKKSLHVKYDDERIVRVGVGLREAPRC
jgi:hypothetical protein